MTQRLEIYRCNVCKNIAEIVLEGEGALVCCGEEMELLVPASNDSEGSCSVDGNCGKMKNMCRLLIMNAKESESELE